MPFTCSHPAAAVPLAKYRLPLSALVVGSMAPDFPYFIPFTVPYTTDKLYGHTWPGLFWFCLPAGLMMLWLFHGLLKLPLLALLPAPHQARLLAVATTFRFGPPRHFMVVMGALLLGAVTHDVWDAFTHESGWAVQHLAILHVPVRQTSYGTLYPYEILQQGSSLVGAALLYFWYRRWFRQASALSVPPPFQLPERLKPRLSLGVVGLALGSAGIYSKVVTSPTARAGWLQQCGRTCVVVAIEVWLVELVILSGVLRCVAVRQKRSARN